MSIDSVALGIGGILEDCGREYATQYRVSAKDETVVAMYLAGYSESQVRRFRTCGIFQEWGLGVDDQWHRLKTHSCGLYRLCVRCAIRREAIAMSRYQSHWVDLVESGSRVFLFTFTPPCRVGAKVVRHYLRAMGEFVFKVEFGPRGVYGDRVLGGLQGMEVTHSAGGYLPHVHVLLACACDWWAPAEVAAIKAAAVRHGLGPVVNVQRVYSAHSVSQVLKYPVKFSGMGVRAKVMLDMALRRCRQLRAWGVGRAPAGSTGGYTGRIRERVVINCEEYALNRLAHREVVWAGI